MLNSATSPFTLGGGAGSTVRMAHQGDIGMALRLDEERIMVVGGRRGIGKAIARALATEGVGVALLGAAIDILVNAGAHACRTQRSSWPPSSGRGVP